MPSTRPSPTGLRSGVVAVGKLSEHAGLKAICFHDLSQAQARLPLGEGAHFKVVSAAARALESRWTVTPKFYRVGRGKRQLN